MLIADAPAFFQENRPVDDAHLVLNLVTVANSYQPSPFYHPPYSWVGYERVSVGHSAGGLGCGGEVSCVCEGLDWSFSVQGRQFPPRQSAKIEVRPHLLDRVARGGGRYLIAYKRPPAATTHTTAFQHLRRLRHGSKRCACVC